MTPSEVVQMIDRLSLYLSNEFPLSVEDADYAAMKLIKDNWITTEPAAEENN